MNWYQKLDSYFPPELMKHPDQMQDMVRETEWYLVEYSETYVVVYGLLPTFTYLDFLWVREDARCMSIGSNIMKRLKARGKPILMEVEPVVEHDPDSGRRATFYLRNGCKPADHIEYLRPTEEGTIVEMDIYHWSPTPTPLEKEIFDLFSTACMKIHNWKWDRYYRFPPADPKKVLKIKGGINRERMVQAVVPSRG
ncbi:GNAT family N-acetyltransferase [Desmospora activa]|uniref:N-acetyltransferase domain-containing protein n=1 Tax=Desmospora activa DSM 45169 TaxID=1121389 RepID=A0A2T4YZL1_9BACL|nr:GNAT family N-acetyltransferase [Desmospora activa]PTM52697.1 hypothetical protein C8J48_3690 [Desmospora activa DSM 45169]